MFGEANVRPIKNGLKETEQAVPVTSHNVPRTGREKESDVSPESFRQRRTLQKAGGRKEPCNT